MKLIIGIGNPGEEYEDTRHNIGFALVDLLAKKAGADFAFEKKYNAEIAKERIDNIPVILVKPHTFVNKTGDIVKKLKTLAKAKNEDIIVVQDDLDIPFGNTKMSFEKNSGGHKGIESIISALKTNKFYRLRIGTATRKLNNARDQRTLKQKKEAVGGYVLSRFTPSEQTELKKVFAEALEKLSQVIK